MMTKEEYAQSQGLLCPFCKSHNIEGASPFEVTGNTAVQDVRCLDCGKEWEDVFRLVGFNTEGE